MFPTSRTALARLLLVVVLVLVSVASLPWTPSARAAVIPAGNVAELIAAIDTANTVAGADEIVLTADATYTLTVENNLENGLPVIGSEITITGNGATITRDAAAPAFRILQVASGGSLTLHNLTISNGSAGFGGGIDNSGTLTLTNSTLSGNTADNGGGIYNYSGTLTLTNSTLSGNTATYGGGIDSYGGTLTLTNSTLSGNTAEIAGGSIDSYGGTLTLTNSTLSGNTATYGGGIANRNAGTLTLTNSTLSGNSAINDGGGIYTSGDSLTLTNTIVAGNGASNGLDINGLVADTAGGHNLIGDGTDMTGLTHGVNGNLVGTTAVPIDPVLGLLADNGGPTLTMALLPGSPAINVGNDAVAPDTDQRGVVRPQGEASDIGAYELDETPPVITPSVTGTLGTNGWYTSDVTVSWSVTDTGSDIIASDGCDPATIETDTVGTTLTCSASSAGGTNEVSTTIKRDTAAPGAILAVTAGTAGDNGWYTSAVTIATTLAGPAPISGFTCTAAQFLTSDSTGVTFSGSCVSGAGLSGAPASLTVKLDSVAPLVAVVGVTAGASYPLGSVPATTCETVEATSGVAVPAVLSLSGGPLGEVTATCSAATDNAGLTGSLASVTYTVTVMDSSAPTVTPSVSGTLGLDNWYTSDVTVSWSVTDDESDITDSTGCDPTTINADTTGTTLTCEATSAGGENSASVTIKRDATAPVITYSGNQDRYGPFDAVAITCAASDAMSGIASDTCADVSGPVSAFAFGQNDVSAEATDNAGNVGSGSTSFVVGATHAELCALTEQYVSLATVARSACAMLAIAEQADGSFVGEMALINYRVQIQSAISRRYVSAADGAELIAWSRTL